MGLSMTVTKGNTIHFWGNGKLFKISTITRCFEFFYTGKKSTEGISIYLLKIEVENG